MKIGISSYALTWSIGVPGYEPPSEPLAACGLLELAARRGVRLVQIADNLPLHALSDTELTALAERADELGIALEVGTRGTEPGHLLRYLEIAARLRSPLVRTLITEPELALAERDIATVLPQYEREGVLLAIENHGLHTTAQLTGLFDSLASPSLGCCLDTVNSFGALEAPETVIRALAPYTVNLHLKDFDIRRVDHQMGFTILGAPAGYGKLNIPSVLAELRRCGRSPSAVLELWVPYAGSVDATARLEREWLEVSLDYLTSVDFEQ